ncbi:triose-phosphate isomerase [Putridiphycobacter roseus]|uniref:Triosephosphate isomerase n=1 Tax=Putridiphycobacter roseus TaxID=2219161 RepID=A0A2W1N0K7_9FLAO|nr:triose-phosphate isomerase [Putridiphycobacter roseus]PZE17757.1 triose-phosphate isomerase [Putridiphycobacter roseus]
MKKYIIGNWKMNLDYAEAKSLLQEVAKAQDSFDKTAEIVVCPPLVYISVFHELLKNNEWIKLGAQNVYCENNGAFTGEVSPTQLKSMGVSYVIIGHSERRQYFGEDNKMLLAKVKAVLKQGMTPIFCCGEHLQVRKSNVFKEFVMKQIEDVLFELSADEMQKVIIAYEPIWAIGTGQTATAAQAQEIHALIRLRLEKQFGAKVSTQVPIIYGGSMKPDNAGELLGQKDIDGGLIGGASLDAESFAAISKVSE